MSEEHLSLSKLEQWYASQCNGDWEHAFGVRIDTLDNPAWSVAIDLRDTRKQFCVLERQKLGRAENDWIQYWVEKEQFPVTCGPLNLSEATEIFVRCFASDSG